MCIFKLLISRTKTNWMSTNSIVHFNYIYTLLKLQHSKNHISYFLENEISKVGKNSFNK